MAPKTPHLSDRDRWGIMESCFRTKASAGPESLRRNAVKCRAGAGVLFERGKMTEGMRLLETAILSSHIADLRESINPEKETE